MPTSGQAGAALCRRFLSPLGNLLIAYGIDAVDALVDAAPQTRLVERRLVLENHTAVAKMQGALRTPGTFRGGLALSMEILVTHRLKGLFSLFWLSRPEVLSFRGVFCYVLIRQRWTQER